jgi:hypothetical protein
VLAWRRKEEPVARLEVNDPSLVDDLIAKLRALDCAATRVGERAIDVAPAQEGEPWHPPNQVAVELAFLVRAWLRERPDVEVRVIP